MRKYYLDNIRWITVVLVVIYHVIYIYNGITVGVIGPFAKVQYQDGVQYILYPWFMMLLFIVAGICSRYYLEKHTVKEFARARTRKLLVPSTIGLLAFGWLQGYFNMAISDVFSTIPETMPKVALYLIMVLSGTGVLWFIQMLWIFSLLLALVRKAEKGKLYVLSGRTNLVALILMAVPVYISGLLLKTPIIPVYRFGIYGFSFFLGYFLFAHEEVIERLSRAVWPLIISALILGGVYLNLHFGDNYAVAPTVNCVSASVYGWIACLAILGAAKRWGNRENRLTRYMTKRSFGLYVFHYLPLSAAAYGMHTYLTVAPLPSYLLTGIAAFAGSLILYESISRIPVLRWCVLGIRKEKGEKKCSKIIWYS